MRKLAEPPSSREFASETQAFLWLAIGHWLAAHSNLPHNYYACGRDNVNGRYHNFLLELPPADVGSFAARVHVYVCSELADFRLGYWGQHFNKQERRIGGFFNITMTKEVEREDGTLSPSGLPNDRYAARVVTLLNDVVEGRVKVNVTKLGSRPVKWCVFQWRDIGWIELGTTYRGYSLFDAFKPETRAQLTFKSQRR